MTQAAVGVEVHCSNDRCGAFIRTKERRYIGIDGGAGGKWQCRICNKWTFRFTVT